MRTFIFGDLSNGEKDKFLDFMIKNNVQFSFDQSDNMYVATVKIVNKDSDSRSNRMMDSRRQSR